MRQSLVEAARRYTRLAHEAEDIAHDLIVAALQRGLALDGEVFLRGLAGSARRHSAFLARTAGRRRVREARYALLPVDAPDEGPRGATREVALSTALRTTLLLLAAGLDKAELRVVLGVTDAALRQRFSSLRGAAPLARPMFSRASPSSSPQFRRSQTRVLSRLAAGQRALAVRDPDGHGLVFMQLTPEPLSAT